MVVNPCLVFSVKAGARAVVGFEFLSSVAFFVTSIITLQRYGNGGQDAPVLLFGIAYLLFSLIQAALAYFLFRGISQNHYPHCSKWFMGAWAVLVILITFAACETYQGRLTANILWAKPVLLGFLALIKLYCIWVVYDFMEEIRYKNRSSPSKSPV